MSENVSFRCRGELYEFLEEEAERRMTTKSTVAQMLLAEKAREMGAVSDEPGDDGPDVFARQSEHWYKPDGEHKYAVELNEVDRTKYYKTRNGAAKRLKREYE